VAEDKYAQAAKLNAQVCTPPSNRMFVQMFICKNSVHPQAEAGSPKPCWNFLAKCFGVIIVLSQAPCLRHVCSVFL